MSRVGLNQYCKILLFLLITLLVGGCGPSLNSLIIEGDITKAKNTIEQGQDIEETDSTGRTPLMHACMYGPLELVELLIEKGANIQASDDYHWTPLLLALKNEIVGAPTLLVNKGADVNVATMGSSPNILVGPEPTGITPLILASKQDLELVKLMVEAGANVNVKDSKGGSPLYFALLASNEPMTEYLLENGANEKEDFSPACAGDSFGFSTSHVAQVHQNYAKYLAKKGNLEEVKAHYAEAVNYFEKASEILKAKELDLRSAARKGAILDVLNWHPIRPPNLAGVNEGLAETFSNAAIEALVNSRKCQKILECYKKLKENDFLGKCQELGKGSTKTK